jgi:excisionase family DNA binding protein
MKAKLKKARNEAALEASALRMAADNEAGACTEKVLFPKHTAIPFNERIYGTIRQTCEATGLGHDTIYRLMKSGRLQSITIGKRRLIVVASLLKLGNVDDLPKYAAKRAEKTAADSELVL